jgi:tRNA G46 methylase TrmB
MYSRLNEFLSNGQTNNELLARTEYMPDCLVKLFDIYLSEYQEEQSIKEKIETFNTINHATSQMIAENYEEYPYPRWIDWEFPQVGQRKEWLHNFFKREGLSFLGRPFDVLVAGCGTGSKAIEYAIGYGGNAIILAIDLSRASLAYATRMAHKHGVDNIKFMQMDIFDVPKLNM